MEQTSKKNWWFLIINGIIAILFGIFLLFFDKDQIQVFMIYIGIAILIIGAFLLFAAIRNIRKNKHAGMLLFESILTLVIGLIMVLFPSFSLKFFLIIIGVWAIILGIAQLAILINIKEKMANKNILLFNGLLTIVLGVLLFIDPITTAGIVLKILGAFAIIFGILMIYFGFVLKVLKPVISEEPKPEPEIKE
ncbi:MAG: DUF308 domain-containing protein [Bacteroidales bacterium]|nr:DUF308 domain-containing protein [Bacteroidales bacterium]